MFKEQDTSTMEQCKVCSMDLHSALELELHCLHEHGTLPEAVKCQRCDFIAADQEVMNAHTEYEHYTGARRNERCRELVAGLQCMARFTQIRELRKHLAAAHGLDAALDTVREEFASWEEFLRWKAQFELETRSVYKIGYGRRNGHRRYMCIRSGRYTPVPDEIRQRRPRENRTIKLGFNCTATMLCKFPATGGVRVEVHPFHYGHSAGDVRLPGMKPEGAPDNWIRPDTCKKKKYKSAKAEEFDVITVDMAELGDGDTGPLPELSMGDSPRLPPDVSETGSQDNCQGNPEVSSEATSQVSSQEVDPKAGAQASPHVSSEVSHGVSSQVTSEINPGDSPQESAPAVTSITITADTSAPVGGFGHFLEVLTGGDTPFDAVSFSDDVASGEGSVDRSGVEEQGQEPRLSPDRAQIKAQRWRRPGPKSKCGPPLSTSPPPEPELEPHPRRGVFGFPLPSEQRHGSGYRYKRLLRRSRTMQGLRKQLGAQLMRLGEAREKHIRTEPKDSSVSSTGTGGGTSSSALVSGLVGTPLENVTEIDETPPPLAVLRAEPGDLDMLPDVVFPEMELLTAPTDLQDATDTIRDLKMEVLSLRARLVRRAAVETALRADALEASARHEATVRELRAELKKAHAALDCDAERMRKLLESQFSRAQLIALQSHEADVPWDCEDYEQAITLRWLSNRQTFEFVRHGLKVPLPSMAEARMMAANGRPQHIADNYMEMVRSKALEGDRVEEDEDTRGHMEVRMVLGGPGQTVEVPALTDAVTPNHVDLEAAPIEPTSHDHGFSPRLLRRRLRTIRPQPVTEPATSHLPAATTGIVRNFRLFTADGTEEPVTMTLRVMEDDETWQAGPEAVQDRRGDVGPTAVTGQLEGPVQDTAGCVGPDGVAPGSSVSADGRELSVALAAPSETPSAQAQP